MAHAGFRVPREKVTHYLLNLRHPEGGSKARLLQRLGFSPKAPEVLERALLAHAEEAEEVERRPGLWGEGLILVLRGPLRGPKGSGLFQSVWYLEEGTDAFRLVTVYPWRKG